MYSFQLTPGFHVREFVAVYLYDGRKIASACIAARHRREAKQIARRHLATLQQQGEGRHA